MNAAGHQASAMLATASAVAPTKICSCLGLRIKSHEKRQADENGERGQRIWTHCSLSLHSGFLVAQNPMG